MNSRKDNKLYSSKQIQALATFLVLTFIIFYLSGGTYEWIKIISLACITLWGIMNIILLWLKNRDITASSITVSVSIFLLYFFITGALYGDILLLVKMTVTFALAFSPFLILNFLNNISESYERKAQDLIIIVFIFYLIANMVFLINNPFLPRTINNDILLGKQFFLGAGYYISYASSIYGVFAATVLKQRLIEQKRIRLGLIFSTFVTFVIVYYTGSTITLISLFIGVGIAVLYVPNFAIKKGILLKKKIIRFTVTPVIIMIIIIFSPQIGNVLMNNNRNKSNAVEQRLFEIGEYVTFQNSSDDNLPNRLNTILRGVNGIKSNPIFGIGYKVGNITVDAKELGVSGHSELVDLWAMYGVIGFILIIYIYVHFFRGLKIRFQFFDQMPVIVTILIMAIFNPFINFQTNFVIMLLIPIFLQKIEKNKPKIFQSEAALKI